MTSSEPAPTLDRAHASVSPRLQNWRPGRVRPWSRPLGSCHTHHAGVEGALGARAPTSTPAARWSTAGAGSRRRGGHRQRSASPRQCHLGRPPEHVGAAARCRAAARRRPPTRAHARPPQRAPHTHPGERERFRHGKRAGSCRARAGAAPLPSKPGEKRTPAHGTPNSASRMLPPEVAVLCPP